MHFWFPEAMRVSFAHNIVDGRRFFHAGFHGRAGASAALPGRCRKPRQTMVAGLPGGPVRPAGRPPEIVSGAGLDAFGVYCLASRPWEIKTFH